MKYHATISTILISVSVAIMFALVGFFIIISLNMTSPTLIAANRLLENIENIDSDIELSFSHMDRNFKEGVFINDLSIKYKGEDLFKADKVTLKKSLFELIAYLVRRGDLLQITVDNGTLIVPQKSSEKQDSNTSLSLDDDISFKIPDALKKWGIQFDIFNLNLKWQDRNIENIKLSLDWNYGLKGSSFSLNVPALDINERGITAHLSDSALSLNIDESAELNLKLGTLDFGHESYKGSVSTLFFKSTISDITSFNLKTIPFTLSLKELFAESEDMTLENNGLIFAFSDDTYSLKTNALMSSYKDYVLSLGGISVLTKDFDNLLVYLQNGKLNSDMDLVDFDAINASVSLKAKSGMIKSDKLSSSALNSLSDGILEEASLRDLMLSFGVGERVDLDLKSSAEVQLRDKDIDYIKTDLALSSSLDLSDGFSLDSLSLMLDDISSPFFSESGYVHISGGEEGFNGEVKLGSNILSSLSFDNRLKGTLDFRGYSLSSLSPIISSYASAFASYISDETKLNGSISFDLSFDKSAKLGLSGPVSFNFALNSIAFNEYSFNLATSMNGSLSEDKLNIEEGAITSDFLRAYFNGGIDFTNMLPYGEFVLSNTKSGNHYVDLDLAISGERVYSFRVTTPYLENTAMSGSLNLSVKNQINSYAELVAGSNFYPFDINVNLEEKNVALYNPEIDFYLSWHDILSIILNVENLSILPNPNLEPSYIDGDFEFSFDFAKQAFALKSDSFNINNISLLNGSPDISFKVKGDNDSVRVNDISIISSEFNPLSGNFLLDFKEFAILFGLSDNLDNGENLYLSIIKDDAGFSGLLSSTKLNLSRFNQDGLIGRINLTGNGKSINDFVFSGSFKATSEDEVNSPKSFDSSIIVDAKSLTLSDISYTTDTIKAGIDEIYIDSTLGTLSLDNANLSVLLEHTDRTYSAAFSLSLLVDLPEEKTLYDMSRTLYKNKGNGITFSGSINSVNYDNSLIAPYRSFTGLYSDKLLKLSGDAISGSVDLSSGMIDLDFNLMPIAEFNLKSDKSNPLGRDFLINFKNFATSIANLSFPSPILVFYDNSYIRGELDLIKREDGYSLFGNLDSDRAEFDLFWVPGERIILHNANFIIWDNVITSNLTNLTALDLETNERTPGYVSLELNFGRALSFESYEVDVYLDEGKYVNFRLPVYNSNIDIIGKASGHYHIDNVTGVVASSGNMRIKDAVLSLGMRELPAWFKPLNVEVSNDFEIELVSNNEFIMPLSETPILSAFMANNTKFDFYSDKNGMVLGGDLNIRSGELYYIQKYFYITEGSIHFEENTKSLDPIVNLSARLRDFDSDGKQVDIYLSLQDSKLDNINPSFSSSPAKPLNEIMQILGQAILPTATYSQSSLTRVASLVTASFDVLSRVGIFKNNTTGLDKSIKESLGLDVFSLHSNIVSNIITDTIALSGLASASSELSPMARYMDGTSIYIGKYIRPDIYLQTLLHLSASYDKSYSKHTFLSDDLVLDSEFSVEWNNPMCTFTFFTKPTNLTFYSIFEGFGFSVSKRLTF